MKGFGYIIFFIPLTFHTVAYLEDRYLLESVFSDEIANIIFTLKDHNV